MNILAKRKAIVVNLHGFNSAGNNNGFARLGGYFEPRVSVISPSYTVHNFSKGCTEILDVLAREVRFPGKLPPVFVGSSTGALYAEALARKFKGGVVLINPVMNPEQLKPLIGHQKNYATGVEYEFTQQDWETFLMCEIDMTLPRLVFYEQGDEKLDHQLTREFYSGYAQIIASDGESHRFSHWEEALPVIDAKFFRA